MNNSIYIRRKNKVVLAAGNHQLPVEYLHDLVVNVNGLGYTLSPELLEIIGTYSIDELKIFYEQMISDLKSNIGANVEYSPMYPNFPDQVSKASQAELKINSAIHYIGDWIGRRILPVYKKEERTPLQDSTSIKVISLGTVEEFNSIFTRLVSANAAVSDADKHDIEWFIRSYRENIKTLLPGDLPSKENTAFILGCFIRFDIPCEDLLNRHTKTATDVLRIAVALSAGDVSLAENTRFKNLSKKMRKTILRLLETVGNITEDMLRHKERWKRLGERLHPSEYKQQFPKVAQAFDIIRNDIPFETFNAKIEKAISSTDIQSALRLLRTRPGELARRLDKLLREASQPAEIIEAFTTVAPDVSSPVLLQVHCHFKYRNELSPIRTFFPKGDVGKVQAIDNLLPPISVEICNEVMAICENALIARFKKLKPLGKTYIDKRLNNYTVPFGIRSASKSLVTLSRGSRINLPEGDTIRFFIYWKDAVTRTDIDLSALALDRDSRFKEVIAYYNLKSFGGFHSGDITSAPDGASEFIDIEISKFIELGIRYVLMSITSFTEQQFRELPICFAGFMMRQHPGSGEIYEPATVQNKFDITSGTAIAIPLIIDLHERKVIWTDLSLKKNVARENNVHHNLSSLGLLNKAMVETKKPNLFDLFSLHIKARGEQTDEIAKANTIFGIEKGIKPTDFDIILSELL